MNTLIHVVENHLLDATAINFYYLRNGEEPTSKTYLEVVADAKKLAQYLASRFELQSRIVLVYPPGLAFISSFLGCLYAGMIAVPAYPLQNPRHAYRLQSILDSSRPSLILGSQRVIDDLNEIESFNVIEKLATEAIFETSPVIDFQINPAIHDTFLAFLQYTSGSTGKPKGVMVSHANLMSNLASLKTGWGLGANKTSVLWLPVQHDLGLIGGVLSSLYNKNDLVLLPPVSVIENPYRWLKALMNFKAYFTAGPNFAYQLCVNKISEDDLKTLDLSSVGYAVAGSEPNRCSTMMAFLDKFAACGFKKEAYCVGYGLAENTLHVTTNTPNELSQFIKVSKQALEHGRVNANNMRRQTDTDYFLMSAGALHPAHHVVIVNPTTKARCEVNEVGEIWLHGDSVAQGYWNNPEATDETFKAMIIGEAEYYLRTGDLGFIQGNQLYVTGRQKDLIIIDGRNIYPQDIELIVDHCHEWIKPSCTAVFSIDTGHQEGIVVCAEIKRTAIRQDLSDLKPIIRHAIASQYDVAVHDIKLLKPNRSFKTTSG
jgi:acyl-CoA synthetase (AMP-forming)/AMP-acid ligase II